MKCALGERLVARESRRDKLFLGDEFTFLTADREQIQASARQLCLDPDCSMRPVTQGPDVRAAVASLKAVLTLCARHRIAEGQQLERDAERGW